MDSRTLVVEMRTNCNSTELCEISLTSEQSVPGVHPVLFRPLCMVV